LCWTEFYNGKWQPTKTSDVARPANISGWRDERIFAPSGDGSFDEIRNLITIVPCDNPDHMGALELNIVRSTHYTSERPVFGAGFIMFNSHSLPAHLENVSSYPYEPLTYRYFFPYQEPYTCKNTSGTLTVNYGEMGGNDFSHDVISFRWVPRLIDAQPGLSDYIGPPFIYEDRQYQFYVTTEPSFIPYFSWMGFGAEFSGLGPTAGKISPLIVKGGSALPSGAETINGEALGFGYSRVVQRYLAQTSNLKVVLASDVTVSFDDRDIQLGGSSKRTTPAFKR
jgi:hypothetical protein